MKMLSALAALMLGTTAAVAGPFGLPDHQPNGYRDTGCDPAQQRQITNADGEYLYSNNPTCGSVGGSASFGDFLAAMIVPAEDDEEPEAEPKS